MADELIKVNNSEYSRYEELLLRRDEVKKEAFQLQQSYIREFGKLILDVFEKKLECIKKKKTIEFCQRYINQGKSVDQAALQDYLTAELKEYEMQLQDMVKENENAQGLGELTEVELLQVKKIYRRLVKKIHPDINPVMDSCEKLQELWYRLTIAYECNNLKEMQETEVLINALLKQLDIGTIEIDIPDIEDKIEELLNEIEEIKSRDPYQYKFLLDDTEAVKEKKQSLQDELKEYEEYSAKLDEILGGMMLNGASFTFVMK